jgi:type III pantothenate kinase
MLLLIDAGNTRAKWAMLPNEQCGSDALGRWTCCGSVLHAEVRQLSKVWREQSIVRVLISNVAGDSMRIALEQTLLGALGMRRVPLEWFSSTPALAGVRNGYRDPAQLGSDRFAALIGAHAMFPSQPLIVATCGTATTVDAVTNDGVFLGGMILPGLGLMAGALAENTAQLPQVAANLDVSEPFADCTATAIVSGCIAAQAGAIERAIAAHERRYGRPQCVLSGGAAALISPHLPMPHATVDNLVLIGLHAVAMQ